MERLFLLDAAVFPSLTANTTAAAVVVLLCFPADEDVLINQRMALKSAARAE